MTTLAQWNPKKMPIIGILGGGQLARMLVLQGYNLGIKTHVYCQSMDEPAAQVSPNVTLGSFDDEKVLKKWAEQIDIITFENEFVSSVPFRKADFSSKTFSPNLDAMERIRDRYAQKEMLKEYGVSTIPYDLGSKQKNKKQRLSVYPLVYKKRFGGYDGQGTFIVKSKSEEARLLERYPMEEFLVEPLYAFDREVATMVFRSADGSFVSYPFVETVQRRACCFSVHGPLIGRASYKQMLRKLKKMMESINYIGALGVEMFEKSNELHVNELAPRVHNSGHYSLDVFSWDQFTLHLLSVAGLPIKTPVFHTSGFAMVNLLSKGDGPPSGTLSPQIKLYWYGKSQFRQNRKIGHMTAIDDTPEQALARVLAQHKKYQL